MGVEWRRGRRPRGEWAKGNGKKKKGAERNVTCQCLNFERVDAAGRQEIEIGRGGENGREFCFLVVMGMDAPMVRNISVLCRWTS